MANMTVISRKAATGGSAASHLSPAARQHMIDEAAYYRYVERGYAPGHELDDWLAAEADFERASFRRQAPPQAENAAVFGIQQSSTLSPAEDDALKRAIKRASKAGDSANRKRRAGGGAAEGMTAGHCSSSDFFRSGCGAAWIRWRPSSYSRSSQ